MSEPTDFVRVTNKDTGNKLTLRRSQLAHGNYTELKQPAVDPQTLEPLPTEFRTVEPTPATGQSADQKES